MLLDTFNKYRLQRKKFALSGLRYFIRVFRIRALQFFWRNSTNTPYLSGDSIAELCEYVVKNESSYKLERKKIESAKSIFVYGDHIHGFLEACGSSIKAEVIVVGNSDVNFKQRPRMNDCVKLFLAQNASYDLSPTFGVLPIGIENLKLGRLGNPKWYKEKLSFEFEHKVLVPPMSPTNPIRSIVLKSPALENEVFHVFRDYLDEKSYFRLVAKYRFILALEGNGYENHRIWEALYQNSFPVMLRSKWAENIKTLGLPILLVDDVNQITETLLRDHLANNQDFSAAKCQVLWTPFWQSKINQETIDL